MWDQGWLGTLRDVISQQVVSEMPYFGHRQSRQPQTPWCLFELWATKNVAGETEEYT